MKLDWVSNCEMDKAITSFLATSVLSDLLQQEYEVYRVSKSIALGLTHAAKARTCCFLLQLPFLLLLLKAVLAAKGGGKSAEWIPDQQAQHPCLPTYSP